MFTGHTFTKLINENWVFDFTEYIGYKVELNKQGEVRKYTEAFRAVTEDNKINFLKSMSVPVKVLREAQKQIELYQNDLGGELGYSE